MKGDGNSRPETVKVALRISCLSRSFPGRPESRLADFYADRSVCCFHLPACSRLGGGFFLCVLYLPLWPSVCFQLISDAGAGGKAPRGGEKHTRRGEGSDPDADSLR